jgi:hypothetical protein
VLTKAKAIEKLQQQTDLIDEIRKKPRFSPDFEKWYRDTEVAIENIFGKDSRHIKDFTDINYSLMVASTSTPDHKFTEAFQRGLTSATAVLKSMMNEVEEYWNNEPVESPRTAIATVERICNRFHLVVKQLHSRYNSRKTLSVEDEYDVQDLLQALLILDFDDIRPEEWTPSYAGSCSRVDFLLKQEQVVVEVKKTRKGLDAREVGEQLIIDIKRYQAHQDCQTLICFVYDPEERIANPRGIENDLNGHHGGLKVRVIIAPKGL